MLARRFDNGSMVSIEKTPEGFYKGIARVTRTGVFVYRNADGTLRRELRHPDDVFNTDSLNTMKMIPLTNLHPADKLVNVDNAKELSIGFTGENVTVDGKFVLVPITITTNDGISAVEKGRKELSLGYEVELVNTPGRYDGEEYDYVQRDIKYNHLAIVDRGRAGPDVRLAMDSVDAVEVHSDNNTNNQHSTRSDSMVKVRLDNGLEYEAAPEVVVAFAALQTKLDGLSTENKTLLANADKLRADSDTATETNKQLQAKLDATPAAITEAVKARVDLVKVATDSLDTETVAKLDSMSNEEIKKAVVIARFPEAKLDGVSAEYLQARFDAACEIKVDASAAAAQRQATIPRTDGKSTVNAEARREEMIKNMKERSMK